MKAKKTMRIRLMLPVVPVPMPVAVAVAAAAHRASRSRRTTSAPWRSTRRKGWRVGSTFLRRQDPGRSFPRDQGCVR